MSNTPVTRYRWALMMKNGGFRWAVSPELLDRATPIDMVAAGDYDALLTRCEKAENMGRDLRSLLWDARSVRMLSPEMDEEIDNILDASEWLDKEEV